MADLTIRRATESDQNEMRVLLNELGYEIAESTLAKQLLQYNQPQSIALVADCPTKNIIVGLASAHVIPLLHQNGYLGRITSMVVSTDSRGSGVGRKLVEALETWFTENECLRYEVTSGEHRKSAHLFYEAMGYAPDACRFIKLA